MGGWSICARSRILTFATFSLFERRHHCRKCGDIFCATHCSNYFRLDQSINFNPHGDLVRGCDTCARQQQRWLAIMRRASLVPAEGKQEENASEVAEVPTSS